MRPVRCLAWIRRRLRGDDKLLLDAFPRSSVVVHDYSEPMMQEARLRLACASGLVSYSRGDLLTAAWTDDVRGTFDAVISAISIHNVRYPQRIRAIYREVYDLLEDGGCFYNVDYVTPPGRHGGARPPSRTTACPR